MTHNIAAGLRRSHAAVTTWHRGHCRESPWPGDLNDSLDIGSIYYPDQRACVAVLSMTICCMLFNLLLASPCASVIAFAAFQAVSTFRRSSACSARLSAPLAGEERIQNGTTNSSGEFRLWDSCSSTHHPMFQWCQIDFSIEVFHVGVTSQSPS